MLPRNHSNQLLGVSCNRLLGGRPTWPLAYASPQMAGMRGYTLGQSLEELWTMHSPGDASAGVFDTALRWNLAASRCATAEDASGSLGALSG